MRVKDTDDEKQSPPPPKEPMEMTSDELLEFALEPELAEEVKRAAKPPESTDSEQEC